MSLSVITRGQSVVMFGQVLCYEVFYTCSDPGGIERESKWGGGGEGFNQTGIIQ